MQRIEEFWHAKAIFWEVKFNMRKFFRLLLFFTEFFLSKFAHGDLCIGSCFLVFLHTLGHKFRK